MDVVISDEVLTKINEYSEALTRYPISEQRAKEKVANLKSAIAALGNLPMMPPVCMYRDLLQTFRRNGKPRCKELRRYNYTDESGFPWAFSCLYNKEKGTITIMKMMPAQFVVKEDKKAVFSESRLRQIVSEAVRNALRKRLY